jgi:hypothetical protein
MSRAAASLVAIVCMVLAAMCSAAVIVPDYAREERWAQEVVPTLVVGEPLWLATPARPKVLALLAEPQGKPRGAIVLVHALGVNPDFGIIGALRSTLADAGYVTLSVQMPVLATDAPREDYSALFAEAGDRIATAIRSMRERNVGPVALVAHSMGAAMTNAYLARPGAAPIDAWVPIGMTGAFGTPPRERVLDIVAQNELQSVVETAPARKGTLPRDACSAQITVPGHDHYFERGEAILTTMIVRFLERVYANGC